MRSVISRPARVTTAAAALLLQLLWWRPAPAADAPPCRPVAKLAGDSNVVAPIGRVLQSRGIAPDGNGCRQVAVNVRPAGRGYDLVILDPDGRTARRNLPSPEAAALVIESWTRADLAAPLLTESPGARWDDDPGDPAPTDLGPAVREALRSSHLLAPQLLAGQTTVAWDSGDAAPREPAAQADPSAATAVVASSLAPAASATALAAQVSPVSLLLRGETALAPDQSASWGARGGICLRAGPVCLGLLGRYARAIVGTSAANLDLERRQDMDVQLAAELPLHLGPLVIAPTIGVGAGQTSSTWRLTNSNGSITAHGSRHGDGDRGMRPGSSNGDHSNNGPHRPNDGPPDGRQTTSSASNTVRTAGLVDATTTSTSDERRLLGEAGIAVSLPLGAGLALDLGLSVGSALASWGDAEAPRTQLHGGFGLRYGGR